MPTSASINEVDFMTQEEIDFISNHLQMDMASLALTMKRHPGLDPGRVLPQIAARQKAKQKLPEWYALPTLIFPPPLSVEQSSSEATARFKASLMQGEHLIDITGGMGVDCYYSSEHFKAVTCFEYQENVAAATAYNFKVLGAHHISVIAANGLEYLRNSTLKADWIYIDPARRDLQNRKMVSLSDCEPDIGKEIDLLTAIAPKILIKTSPLLDIHQTLSQLKGVTEVFAVGLERECKEVLYLIDLNKPSSRPTDITAIQLNRTGKITNSFSFTKEEEQVAAVRFGDPQKYLYEPFPSLLKAGCFKTIAAAYGLEKVAVNSHLYSSEQLIGSFPGRIFEVLGVTAPNKKDIDNLIEGPFVNLAVRNFPAKPNDLLKKWRLKEGGDYFLFATTLHSGKKAVVVTKKSTIQQS